MVFELFAKLILAGNSNPWPSYILLAVSLLYQYCKFLDDPWNINLNSTMACLGSVAGPVLLATGGTDFEDGSRIATTPQRFKTCYTGIS